MKRPTPGWPTAARALLARSLALVALLATPAAYASGSFSTTWQGIYPASDSLNNADCQLCHAASTQRLNPYGELICSSNAGSISNRIRDVASLDSDFDPAATTNLAEINAGAQPGWTPGNVNPTYNRGDCSPTGLTEAPPTFIAGELDPPAGNQSPVADASGPYSGTVGAAVSFDGSGSSDPDGSIVSYEWDFGDGMTGSGPAPSHAYGTDGSYTVALTVTDDGGATATATATASIGMGNQAPVADPMGPYSGTVGVAVGFDGSGSSDADGSIVAWDWDFGDGSTGSGMAPSHVFSADGSYRVSLTVTDDAGATGTASTMASVGAGNLPPVADANGPYSGAVGMPVSFSSRGSSDPDGSIVAYSWDFGDGSTGTGANPQHAYSAPGLYNVTLEVMDADGATDSAMTTANIREAGATFGDVSIARLLAPRRMNVRAGERVLQRVMVIGRGDGLMQDATVNLTVASPAGVTVNIRPASSTLPVSPEDGATRYRFRAVITCEVGGVYELAWTSTIGATANSEPGNDTLTEVTKLRCRNLRPDYEDDEAEEEEDD